MIHGAQALPSDHFLGERHDVYTVLAESRTYRGSRGCLACGNLELNITYYFLCHVERFLLQKMPSINLK